MRPSLALQIHRTAIREIALQRRVENVRVFGLKLSNLLPAGLGNRERLAPGRGYDTTQPFIAKALSLVTEWDGHKSPELRNWAA
jgi:hypothetical protein